MGRVILQGELRPFGLLNTLQILHNASLSGAMRIHQFGLTFTLYIDRGFLVSAASPEQQPLGARLVAKGHISQEELDEALRKQRVAEERGEPQALGAVLLKEGMVTQADLEECVFDQIVETLCLSLELPSPYFSFTDFEGDHTSEARAYVHFQFALLEAFRIAEEIRSQRGVDVTPLRRAGGSLQEMRVRGPGRAEASV